VKSILERKIPVALNVIQIGWYVSINELKNVVIGAINVPITRVKQRVLFVLPICSVNIIYTNQIALNAIQR
jgi:hypothetical protein